MGHIWWSACEQAIAFQIEEDALEQMLQIEQSITTPLEHLDFVVQSFNKATVLPVDEVVDDFLPPASQGVEEMIKTAQPASGDPFDPGPDFGFGGCRGDVLVKNRGQLLLQFIGQFQFGRVTEEQPEGAPFFGGQISGLLSQGPQAAFQRPVVACGQFCFEPFQFLFAQIIQTVLVSSGNMETINHQADMVQFFPHGFGKAFIHVTTNGMDALFQALRDGAQEFDDGILLTIGQNRQDDHATFRQAGRHNHDKVTVAFLERNLIQTDNVQTCILPPIHAGADPALQDTQDTQDTVIGHPFFDAHVFHRRIDQLQQQMVVIRQAVGTVTLMPIQTLRGRRVPLTHQTLVAPGGEEVRSKA
jgi:hypothetical protein